MISLLLALSLSAAARAEAPEAAWAELTAAVRARPQDMGVRPSRAAPRLPVEAVEELLADPLKRLPELRGWRDKLARPLSSGETLAVAFGLISPARAQAPAPIAVACPGLPKALRGEVERLAGRLASAQILARAAAGSLDEATRAAALAQVGGVARGTEDAPPQISLFERLGEFKQDDMDRAALAAAQAIDAALPALEAAARSRPEGRWSCETSEGDVVVTGAQGAEHDASELSRSLLLVGLGGASRYSGPAAAAGVGQVRAVVDLGTAVIESTGPAAGSGAFGVGLLYLPFAAGSRIEAGDLSIGAGLFGVGAAFLSGDGLRLSSGRFGQGAGAFGVGALSLRGRDASASADLSAQGFGLTRGAGLFLIRGESPLLRCGLKVPDARDEKALLSLCQGVGYGPRAFASGGIGIADVRGDGASLQSSYFTQGAGYWHGLGALFLSGDDAALQARRYSQGSGVHSAAGALLYSGKRGRFANWGVGPAYGWDQGVGVLEADGDANAFQADWAAGRAEVGGRSLTFVSGAGNALRLPDLGTADTRRGWPAYSLARVSGPGNRIWRSGLAAPVAGKEFDVEATPWGVLRVEGGSLDPDVSSRAVAWPDVDRRAESAREEAELAALGARPAGDKEALAWDLYVASHFPFAPSQPAAAAGRLTTLAPNAASDLVAALSPARFDEGLWLRVAFAGLGKDAAGAAERRLSAAQGLEKALVLGLFRGLPAGAAVSTAFQEASDPDWRVRREAASVLGYALGSQGGGEPGRLHDLRSALRFLSGTSSPQEFSRALGDKRPSELLALLGLGPTPSPQQRLDLLSHVPSPFDPVSANRLPEYARLLKESGDELSSAFERELSQAAGLSVMARSALNQSLGSEEPEPEVTAASLVALGAIGDRADLDALSAALDAPLPSLREASSYALAELGESGKGAIQDGLASGSRRRRLSAVLAAAQSTEPAGVELLAKALSSQDVSERMLAAGSLSAFQTTTSALRKDFLPRLKELAAGDPSASVRATAAVVAAIVEPAEKR